MTRPEVSPPKADAGSQFFEIAVFSAFVLGFGVFLVMAFARNEPPDRSPIELSENSLTAGTNADEETRNIEPVSVQQADTRNVMEPIAPAKNELINIQPWQLAKRAEPPAVTPAEIRYVEPALAEKPSVPFPLIEPPKTSEADVVADLNQRVPFVGFNLRETGAALKIARRSAMDDRRPTRPAPDILAILPLERLDGLPFAEKQDCQLHPAQGKALDAYSNKLHERLALADQSVMRRFPTTAKKRRDPAMIRAIENGDWQSEDAIPALMQILQVESTPVRAHLVEMVAKHRSRRATQAIVNRALFDHAPLVRKKAREALCSRWAADYRDQLIEGLRHPWAQAAWNAAETLAAINDKDAIPELIQLLDAPDPAQPFYDDDGNAKVKELVRMSHSNNCLLCHAPARNNSDLVQGIVPDPVPPRTIRRPGPGYYGRTIFVKPDDMFVRADVTYLRQDFSLMHQKNHNPGPGFRFDYLVRTREATDEEIEALESQSPGTKTHYPQREATLYALQQLTGKNGGPNAADWRDLDE